MPNQAKLIRNQVRNVFQEELKEVLNKDLVLEIEKRVMARVELQLQTISKRVEAILAEVDERSRNTAAFVQRQAIIAPPIVRSTESSKY